MVSALIIETLNCTHKFISDSAPTSNKKGHGEPISSWCFVTRHLLNGLDNLLFRKWYVKRLKVHLADPQDIPGKIHGAGVAVQVQKRSVAAPLLPFPHEKLPSLDLSVDVG